MSTTPTLPSDPQSMPLGDLKTAAGLGDPQPAAPQQVPEPVAQPAVAPIVPEAFSVAQDDAGLTVQMSPEFGGEVFKGKDWAEVGPKIAKAKADANSYIKQLKAQPPQPQAPQTQPPVPQLTQEQIDTRKWLKSEYEAVLADDMGITVEELRYRQRLALETGPETYQERQINEFGKLCPDFMDTTENRQAMVSYFNGYDHYPSSQELKTAWANLVYEGKVTRAQPAQQQTTKLPPPMPGTSATQVSGDQNPYAMPLDQLKAAAGLK